jgi:hypothetical protein
MKSNNFQGYACLDFIEVPVFCLEVLSLAVCSSEDKSSQLRTNGSHFLTALRILSNYINFVSSAETIEKLKPILSQALILMSNQIRRPAFRTFFDTISVEDKVALKNLFMLCSDMYPKASTESVRFIDLVLKIMPVELKTNLWVKKSQLVKNLNAASFIPFSLKIKLLTQIGISLPKESDQIEYLKNIIGLSSQVGVNRQMIELYHEATFRGINILELVPELEVFESLLKVNATELTLKLDIILQKVEQAPEDQHVFKYLQESQAIIHKIIALIFGGFNDFDELVLDVQEVSVENATTKIKGGDKKQDAKGKPKRGPASPQTDVTKQVALKAIIPTADEWVFFSYDSQHLYGTRISKRSS